MPKQIEIRCPFCGALLIRASRKAHGPVDCFCRKCRQWRGIDLCSCGERVQIEHPQKEKIAELLQQLDDHQREQAISFLIDLQGIQDKNTPFQNSPRTDLT